MWKTMGLQWYFLASLSVTSVLGDVRFLVIGDWGDPDNTDSQTQVADAMAAYAETFRPELVQTLADNFYPYGLSSLDDPKFDSLWRNMYDQASLAELPWMVSLGNHDYGTGAGEEWNQVNMTYVEPRWNLRHFWYDYVLTDGTTSVHMVVIDTEALLTNQHNPEDMLQWMNQTLEETVADWSIVVAHHPIFSSGASGPTLPGVYNAVLPILEAQQVDLFFAGHDHNAQCMKKIDDPSYTDFIITGTGGAATGPQNPAYADQLRTEYGMDTTFFSDQHGFPAVDITQDLMTVYFQDTANVNLYTYNRQRTVK